MAMIGGYIDSFDEVNGAVVSRRKKGDRIALWTCHRSKKVNLNVWYVESSSPWQLRLCSPVLEVNMMRSLYTQTLIHTCTHSHIPTQH